MWSMHKCVNRRLCSVASSVHDHVWTRLGDRGDMTALSCAQTGRKIKYARLRKLTANMAGWLREKNGRTAPLVTLLPNSLELAVSALASMEADVPLAAVNPDYSGKELADVLEAARPTWVVTTSSRVPALLEAMSAAGGLTAGVVTVDDDITFSRVLHFQELVAQDCDPAGTRSDSGVVTYVDGKAKSVGQKNMAVNCLQLNQGEIEPGDKLAAAIPMWNCHGLIHTILKGLVSGAEIVVVPPCRPQALVTALRETTALPATPSLVDLLLVGGKQALGGIKSITINGPMSQSSVRLAAEFKGQLLHTYGPLEGPLLFQKNGPDPPMPGSVGRPLPGTEAKVTTAGCGEDRLAPHQPGEIHVRGPQLPDGGAWHRTGDTGYYDGEGCFFLTEQADMSVDGLRVSPSELEHTLRSHESVAEAAVFQAGGKLVAAVVLSDPYRPPPTCKELCLHLSAKLAPYKQIEDAIFMSSLPRHEDGSVDKKRLSNNYNPNLEYVTMTYV